MSILKKDKNDSKSNTDIETLIAINDIKKILCLPDSNNFIEHIDILYNSIPKDVSNYNKGISRYSFYLCFKSSNLSIILSDMLFNGFLRYDNCTFDKNSLMKCSTFNKGFKTLYYGSCNELLNLFFSIYSHDNKIIHRANIKQLLYIIPLNYSHIKGLNKYKDIDCIKQHKYEFNNKYNQEVENKIKNVFENNKTIDKQQFMDLFEKNSNTDIFVPFILNIIYIYPFNSFDMLKVNNSNHNSNDSNNGLKINTKFFKYYQFYENIENSLHSNYFGNENDNKKQSYSLLDNNFNNKKNIRFDNSLNSSEKSNVIKNDSILLKEKCNSFIKNKFSNSNPIKSKPSNIVNNKNSYNSKSFSIKNNKHLLNNSNKLSISFTTNYETEVKIEDQDLNTTISSYYMCLKGHSLFIYTSKSKEKLMKIYNLYLYIIKIDNNSSNKNHSIILQPFNNINNFNNVNNFNDIIRLNFMDENLMLSFNNIMHSKLGYQHVNKKYTIGKELGSGSFGKVKLAKPNETSENNNVFVAIKIIDKLNLNQSLMYLVQNEIDIMKILTYEYVVYLIEVLEDNKNIYIIMEYISGLDLFTYLDSKKNVSIESIKIITYKLAKAIKHIHSYGIVHRDIKLDNILICNNVNKSHINNQNLLKILSEESEFIKYLNNIDRNIIEQKNLNDFEVKLIDFGTSKVLSHNELLSEVVGSTRFSSPELLLNIDDKNISGYNRQTDIWSFGIILYFLYSGNYPFDDKDKNKIIKHIINNKLDLSQKDIYSIWNNSLESFNDLVSNCLNKDPSKRLNILCVLKHSFYIN